MYIHYIVAYTWLENYSSVYSLIVKKYRLEPLSFSSMLLDASELHLLDIVKVILLWSVVLIISLLL